MRLDKQIKKSKYFKDLDDLDFYALLRCLNVQIKSFYKNENIIQEGDDSNYIYIIFNGHARSYSLDIEGNRNIINDFPKDSIFGLEYYNTKQKTYKEYLLAIEDTIVIICNTYRCINPCQNRCKRHIDFTKNIFEEFSRLLVENKKRIDIICQSKTRDKILKYLRYVKAQTRKEYFTIPYNRQEMADYLGVERTALSYELSKLKAEGIIDYDKNSFKLIKKELK